MAEFVKALVATSEKSANLARSIRANKSLFQLLVQEKDGAEKNQRFVQDFKTLADVLIQETIKHDLIKKFPDIKASDIQGEESNKFTNQLGDSIVIEVKSTAQETAELLSKVLNDNLDAANLLASLVHNDVPAPNDVSLENLTLPVKEFGIWIDPIDSTAEYIYGSDTKVGDEAAMSKCGLPCVTVLIGVYDKKTGVPVVGVVNQPFYKMDPETDEWTGRWFWGVHYEGKKFTSVPQCCTLYENGSETRGIILISASDDDVLTELKGKFDVKYAAGAGYKLLCVVLGIADAYILSRGTTFRWDSCAPHALARSMEGGVVDFSRASKADLIRTSNAGLSDDEFSKQLPKFQLTYHRKEKGMIGVKQWCNAGGIIAYRNVKFLQQILEALYPLSGQMT